MQTITTADVVSFLRRLAEVMPGHEQHLRDLDARIGDGDLGVTVRLGTRAMAEAASQLAADDPGSALAKAGMAFNRAAASTFGAIFATILMSMGKAVRGRPTLSVADLPDMFAAAVEAVQARGGAQVGEKTVLDVLVPMTETLRLAVQNQADLPGAINAATATCYQALEATKRLEGKHGRSAWFREKTIGVPDPGSAALCLMMDVLRDCVAEA